MYLSRTAIYNNYTKYVDVVLAFDVNVHKTVKDIKKILIVT